MQEKSRVTVIIPNYNGLRFMDQCMDALEQQTYTDFVVLIVDNGSSDGSAEYLRNLAEGRYHFPIRTILLRENTGFSGAVNVGISAADTDYVVLLNNDTEAQPDYLRALVKVLDEEGRSEDNDPSRAGRIPGIFAVSPKMVQLYHQDLLDDAGDGYNLFGWAFQRGVGQPVNTPKFMRRTEVFSACAGAAIYRRDLLEEIRLDRLHKTAGTAAYEDIHGQLWPAHPYFDPLHFAYLEDLDVCFRARVRGWRVLYEPGSVVYHVGSGTSGSKYNHFKVRLAARNNVYLNYKNMPLLMLLIDLPGILAGVLVKQVFFIRRGFGRDYAGGFMEGLRTLGSVRPHKTGFVPGRLGNYIRIERMLLTDTFSYIQDLAVRQAAKLKKKSSVQIKQE